MKIRAVMNRTNSNLCPPQYQIDKVVEISRFDFDAFMIQPQDRYEFIKENRVTASQNDGIAHCLLVLGEGHVDGALVLGNSMGEAGLVAYVAGARNIVQAELEWAVDYIIRQGTEHTASGYWCVYCEELEEKFGLTIPEGSGLDAMLKDALARRPEVAAAEIHNGAIETSFHPEFCQCLDTREEASASFSPERTAELFDNAVTAALELYDGEELYTVLHGSFGMTIQEIREHRYFSDEELSDICGIPRQMLDCGMRVRDILQLDGVSDRASLSHKNSIALVPLEDLKKLTPSGQEEFAALLDARVADIRVDDSAPELMLEGVEPKELERFSDMLEAHEQAEQAMGPTM